MVDQSGPLDLHSGSSERFLEALTSVSNISAFALGAHSGSSWLTTPAPGAAHPHGPVLFHRVMRSAHLRSGIYGDTRGTVQGGTSLCAFSQSKQDRLWMKIETPGDSLDLVSL